jgi:putative flippase GtrA
MINFLNYLRNFVLSIINWFYRPFKSFIPAETFRYAFSGGINVSLDIFLFFVCYNFILKKQIVNFGFISISPHIASFLFVFPVTFTVGFLLSRYITFTDSELHGRVQLFRYALTVAGAILINYVFLKIFVEYLYIWPTISKIFTTVIVVAYSYMLQRHFTFKTGNLSKK